jgi:hypothetical protein
MDLAICAYDYNTRMLEYAGAFNWLYIARDQTSQFLIFRISISAVKGLAI